MHTQIHTHTQRNANSNVKLNPTLTPNLTYTHLKLWEPARPRSGLQPSIQNHRTHETGPKSFLTRKIGDFWLHHQAHVMSWGVSSALCTSHLSINGWHQHHPTWRRDELKPHHRQQDWWETRCLWTLVDREAGILPSKLQQIWYADLREWTRTSSQKMTSEKPTTSGQWLPPARCWRSNGCRTVSTARRWGWTSIPTSILQYKHLNLSLSCGHLCLRIEPLLSGTPLYLQQLALATVTDKAGSWLLNNKKTQTKKQFLILTFLSFAQIYLVFFFNLSLWIKTSAKWIKCNSLQRYSYYLFYSNFSTNLIGPSCP